MPIINLTTRPVTNLGNNLPILGRIYKGEPKTDPKRPGKELSYFRIEMEPAFRQYEKLAKEFFGAEPVELRGAFLGAHTTDDAMSSWFREWSATGLVRECDGVTQNRAYNPNEGRVMYTDAPCLRDKGGCKCKQEANINLIFPVFSEQIKVLGVFRMTTHSSYDIGEIYNRLMGIQTLYGTVYGIPLVLWREAGEISYFDKKEKIRKTSNHHLVKIRADESHVEKMGVTNRLSSTSTVSQLPAPITNALLAPTGDNVIIHADQSPTPAILQTWIGTNGNADKLLKWAKDWLKLHPQDVLSALQRDQPEIEIVKHYSGARPRVYACVIAWACGGVKERIEKACDAKGLIPPDIMEEVKVLAVEIGMVWLAEYESQLIDSPVEE